MSTQPQVVHQIIRIKAVRAEELKKGEFEITFEARNITNDEHKILQGLFPHTGHEIGHLLQVEAVLANIVKD